MGDQDWADKGIPNLIIEGVSITVASILWRVCCLIGARQMTKEEQEVIKAATDSEYLRENFIPRARVETLLGIIEAMTDPRDMLPRATVRTVIKDLLK